MGEVWRLIEEHQQSTPYGASVREIARGAGIKESTLPRWRDLRRLPEPEHLRALARQIHVPYRVLLDAALTDCGYLERRVADLEPSNVAPFPTPEALDPTLPEKHAARDGLAGKGRADAERARQDKDGES